MARDATLGALRDAVQELTYAAQKITAAAALLRDRRPAAQAQWVAPDGLAGGGFAEAEAAAVNLTPEQHAICERVLNVFETGSVQGNYAAISIFPDGPDNIRQVTYGRSQTTEYGNLPELVRMYVDAGGMFSEALRPFVPLVGHRQTPLVDDAQFKELLRKAGAQDPIMRSTQDVFFDRTYFKPALDWAGSHGFSLPLSILVLYDSFIHSGGIRQELRNQFAEKVPSNGGNEQIWIRSYVDVRHEWLLHHPRPAVRASAYRTKDLKREIAKGNWDLSMLPIIANGVPVDAGAGIAGAGIFAEDDSGAIWSDDTFAANMGNAGFAAAAAGDAASLATAILNNPGIKLATVHSSGIADQANAHQNIADTAAGMPARRSTYGTAPGGTVMLDRRLLSGMVALGQQYTFSVSEICGGSHNANSRHYAGIGMDINIVNGRAISASHPDLAAFKQRCRDLGATEVLGPGFPHHDTHVHAAWPRP